MPRGYDERPEYDRPRDAVRRNDGRDVRRAIEPTPDRRTTLEREYQMDDSMDIRMDTRPEPRTANTGTRVAPVRGNEPQPGREVLYRDPRTGELYRDVPSRRTPYENEFDDMERSSRPIIVSATAAEPGQPRPSYAEYFLPGDGIEREVIQAEICRYLGQDATCRPGKSPEDGRPGFTIKAYRALTTAMVRSLQESSAKFRNELADKEKRRRRPEVAYTPIQDHQYDRDMDMDDDERVYVPPERYSRDIDPRDPRAQMGPRQVPPVTSAYIPEPGYPAYSIATAQPNIPPMAYEPRTFAPTGNTTPPTGLRTTAYAPPPPPSEFPSRTTQSAPAPMPAQAYVDPRASKVAPPYAPYSADARHRR